MTYLRYVKLKIFTGRNFNGRRFIFQIRKNVRKNVEMSRKSCGKRGEMVETAVRVDIFHRIFHNVKSSIFTRLKKRRKYAIFQKHARPLCCFGHQSIQVLTECTALC